MYEKHANITTPYANTVIWRYMSIEKLLGLLCDEALFLAQLDGFADRWECVLPKQLEDARWNMGLSGDVVACVVKETRKWLFVNCWHIGKEESAAQWHQYGQETGMAVRTTVGRLKHAITDPKPVYIGRVKYCDHKTHYRPPDKPFDFPEPAFLKRRSFEHEKELRVLYWEPIARRQAKPAASHRLSVDLKQLIERVYISPIAPKWLGSYVKELTTRFDLPDVPVVRSDLYDEHIE